MATIKQFTEQPNYSQQGKWAVVSNPFKTHGGKYSYRDKKQE